MILDDFVGIPWLERGRDRAGCDCWGLIGLVYRERLDIDLPSLRDDYTTVADGEAVTALVEGHIGPWQEIPAGKEAAGDAVLMSMGGRPRHGGVVVSPGLVLHIERGAGSVIESYRAVRIRSRILGFYRHQQLV